MLKVTNLNISFDEFQLYKNASFTIEKNGIYFLAGRNGMGKTTLLKAIKGLIKTDIEVEIDGVKSNSNQITYVTSDSLFKSRLTIKEQLNLISKDKALIAELIDSFKLEKLLKKKGRSLSSGEKAKVAFIIGILEGNKVILIDEIFNHLDADSSKKILEYMERLRETKIIIYTSHKDIVVIPYNKKMIIKDGNIELEENNEFVSTSKLETMPSRINFKILCKFFNFKLRYFISFCFAIVAVILLYLFQVSKISISAIYRAYYQESNLYPFVVETSSVGNSNIVSVSDKIYELEFSSPTYDVISKNAQYGTFDFYKEGASFGAVSFTNFIITDHFRNIRLEDNIIMISDVMANTYSNVITIENDKRFISFYDKKLEVKIFATSFSSLSKKYSKNPILLLRDKEYINDGSAVYGNIYLNATTYAMMERTRGDYLKSTYSENSDINLAVYTDTEAIIGRMPQDANEIVVSYDICSPEDLEVEDTYILSTSFRRDDINKLSVFKTYNIVGVVLSEPSKTIYFASNTALDDYFYKTNERRTLAFEGKNISLSDIDLIRANDFALADDNYYQALDTHRIYETYESKLNVIISLLWFVGIMGVVLYYIIELKGSARDIWLMQNKKVSKLRIVFANLRGIIYNALLIILTMVGIYLICENKGFIAKINQAVLSLPIPLNLTSIDYIFYLFVVLVPLGYLVLVLLLETIFVMKNRN